MSKQSLYTAYANILDYCGIKVLKDGDLEIDVGTMSALFEVDDKKVIMPYQDRLKSFNKDTELVFHPFLEHVNKSESNIVRKLKRVFMVKANMAISNLCIGLMSIVADASKHSKMTIEQRELLKSIPGVTQRTIGSFVTLYGKIFSESPSSTFVSMYSKRSGNYLGKQYPRVGIITFPIMDLLDQTLPVKVAKEDLKVYRALMMYLFPGCEHETEEYNSYSDNSNAPWLDCFLKTSESISSRIEEVVDLFKEHLEDFVGYHFNKEALYEIERIPSYKAEMIRIPPQPGNEGVVETVDARKVFNDTKETSESRHMDVPPPHRPNNLPAPVHRPQAPVTSDGKLNFDAISGYPQQPVVQQPAYPPPMMQSPLVQAHMRQAAPYGYMQQPMPMYQPGYQAPYPVPQQMGMYQQYPQQPMYNPGYQQTYNV